MGNLEKFELSDRDVTGLNERRAHMRLSRDYHVKCKTVRDGRVLSARTRELSLNGARLDMTEQLNSRGVPGTPYLTYTLFTPLRPTLLSPQQTRQHRLQFCHKSLHAQRTPRLFVMTQRRGLLGRRLNPAEAGHARQSPTISNSVRCGKR